MQRPCFTRFHRDEAAGATIETVLWLPVYVFFLTMIFDTSMTFLNKSEILRVMQDANRAYSVGQLRSLGAVEEAIEAGVGRMGATATVSSIPNSGFERNEGLEAALREGWQDIRILRELEDVRAGLLNGDEEYRRSFIDARSSPLVMKLPSNNNTLEMSMLTPGRVHEIRCNNGNGRLNIPGEEVIHSVVIVTDCLVRIGQNGRLENASLFSTNTDRRAIVGASGTTFGADDTCAPGGGAQIVTLGGMEFPASLGIFGSQLIALGDVQFAARADGVQGASVIAGGIIDGTSNSTMARCNRGMEENFTSPHYRMAL